MNFKSVTKLIELFVVILYLKINRSTFTNPCNHGNKLIKKVSNNKNNKLKWVSRGKGDC